MQVSRSNFDALLASVTKYAEVNEVSNEDVMVVSGNPKKKTGVDDGTSLRSIELEMVHTGIVSREEFVQVLRYFRTVHGKSKTVFSNSTDVGVSLPGADASYRVTFPSVSDMNSAAKSSDLGLMEKLPMMQKRRLYDPVQLEGYDMRLNVKSEEVVPLSSTGIRSTIATSLLTSNSIKTVRNKTRFSFVDGYFRYDCTTVTQSSVQDLASSSTTSDSFTKYELEVEYLGKKEEKEENDDTQTEKATANTKAKAKTKTKTKTNTTVITSTTDDIQERARSITMAILRACSLVLKLVEGVDHLIPRKTKEEVMEAYETLTGVSQSYFVGPKPVTLLKSHVTSPSPPGGVTVIGGGYTVTEKADGERRLLFVDGTGKVYTITDNMRPAFMGLMSNGPKNTLLDGEYVPSRPVSAKEASRPLFMCFDAYFIGGKDVRWLPLMAEPPQKKGESLRPDRLTACRRVIGDGFSSSSPSPSLEVRVKEFHRVNRPRDLASASLSIFRERDAGLFPYEIDGLIFTPALSGVKGVVETPGDKTNRKTGGTWDRVFKWKPPEMNTIDFLVRFRANDIVAGTSDDSVYRGVDLLVASEHLPPGSVLDNILRVYVNGSDSGRKNRHHNPQKRPKSMPRLFKPSGESSRGEVHRALLRMDSDGRVLLDDGSEITNNIVVEFAFDTASVSDDVSRRWVPLRVRHDKTQKYRETGSIERTANHLSVAQQVWDSIHDPLTEDVLTRGGVKADTLDNDPGNADPDLVQSDRPYYVRKSNRGGLASLPMMQFHNTWVKERTLLHTFAGEVRSLLDVGSGKGGDLNKWLAMPHPGLERVLGVDLSKDNIVDTENGAYARLEDQYRKKGGHTSSKLPVVLFIAMDAGKRIATTNSGEYTPGLFPSAEDEELARVLWDSESDSDSDSVSDAGIKQKLSRLPTKFRGFASRPFDMVSCQFAVHYFFKDIGTLRAFAANVSSMLAPGGYFVGTCLDGRMVDAQLAPLDRGASIQGVEGGGEEKGGGVEGRLMWHVRKLYEGSMEDAASLEARVGHGIKVFLESIGQAFDEYLVDFVLLCKVMDDAGLYPLKSDAQRELGLPGSSGGFQDLFEEMRSYVSSEGGSDKIVDNRLKSAITMSREHQRYSFLNRWFVFQKKVKN
jgi:SAM-dependent methyltransferase